MKKRILPVILFLLISIGLNAFTRKEYIQENLSKLGIKQDIINETIKLDRIIGVDVFFEESGIWSDSFFKKAQELLEKDKRNFILADLIIDKYLAEGKDHKKYMEISQKYNPYENQRLLYLDTYYRMIGDKSNAEKVLEEIKRKYPDTPILKIAEINRAVKRGNILNLDTIRKKIVEDLSDEKAKRKYGITDETVHSFKLMIILNEMLEHFEKEEYQKGVDVYLDKVVNGKIPEETIRYNKRINAMLMLAVLGGNAEMTDEKKAEQNTDKIMKSEFYKKLEKAIDEIQN